jgi:hypothetical protein
MKRTIVYLAFMSLVLYACNGNKQAKQTLLIGTWHAVKFDNPNIDSFFKNSQDYIDTVGKNNNDATNMMLYHVSNMDSIRHLLQAQFDSAKMLQTNAVLNTVFTFRADSVVILSFNGGIDSSKWSFDSTGALELTDLNDGGAGDKLKMEILSSTDSVLVLKFREDSAYTTVTFHPGEK